MGLGGNSRKFYRVEQWYYVIDVFENPNRSRGAVLPQSCRQLNSCKEKARNASCRNREARESATNRIRTEIRTGMETNVNTFVKSMTKLNKVGRQTIRVDTENEDEKKWVYNAYGG